MSFIGQNKPLVKTEKCGWRWVPPTVLPNDAISNVSANRLTAWQTWFVLLVANSNAICSKTNTWVLISPYLDQEGNKLGSILETRTISTTSRRELSSRFVFLQGKAPKEIHAILTETLTFFFLVGLKTYQHPMSFHKNCGTANSFQWN